MSIENLKNIFLEEEDSINDSYCENDNLINKPDFDESEEKKGYFDLHEGSENTNNNDFVVNKKNCKGYNHFLEKYPFHMTRAEALELIDRKYLIIH